MKKSEHVNHCNRITDWFSRAARGKYFAGLQEHGGSLWKKPVADMLGEEILDLAIYYHTMTDQRKQLESILQSAWGETNNSHVYEAIMLLRHGNIKGEKHDGS